MLGPSWSELKSKEKKEKIWLSPMTKAPTPTGDNTNNATKKFYYTAVADRLRTVSWSNYGHPTGVVSLVYGAKESRLTMREDECRMTLTK